MHRNRREPLRQEIFKFMSGDLLAPHGDTDLVQHQASPFRVVPRGHVSAVICPDLGGDVDDTHCYISYWAWFATAREDAKRISTKLGSNVGCLGVNHHYHYDYWIPASSYRQSFCRLVHLTKRNESRCILGSFVEECAQLIYGAQHPRSSVCLCVC